MLRSEEHLQAAHYPVTENTPFYFSIDTPTPQNPMSSEGRATRKDAQAVARILSNALSAPVTNGAVIPTQRTHVAARVGAVDDYFERRKDVFALALCQVRKLEDPDRLVNADGSPISDNVMRIALWLVCTSRVLIALLAIYLFGYSGLVTCLVLECVYWIVSRAGSHVRAGQRVKILKILASMYASPEYPQGTAQNAQH